MAVMLVCCMPAYIFNEGDEALIERRKRTKIISETRNEKSVNLRFYHVSDENQ